MTQIELIREHLRNKGSITVTEAIEHYMIPRLSAVIQVLREEGFDIKSKELKGNERGNGSHVRYVLLDEKNVSNLEDFL